MKPNSRNWPVATVFRKFVSLVVRIASITIDVSLKPTVLLGLLFHLVIYSHLVLLLSSIENDNLK